MAAYFEIGFGYEVKPFFIRLDDEGKIAEARQILVEGSSTLVGGTISPEPALYNPNYGFHLLPETIEFGEVFAEVCDAKVEYVEEHLSDIGTDFLPDRFWCPWTSTLKREVSEPVS